MRFGAADAVLVGLAFLLWKGRASAEPSKPSPEPAKAPPKQPADVRWPIEPQPPLPTPPGHTEPVRPPPGGPPPFVPPAEAPGRSAPPGFMPERFTNGLHGEPGVLFKEATTGDLWFVPSDPSLSGYRIPGGSKDIP